MVYLSKIYTRIGDKGHTALGTGVMVSKDHPRIEAYGTVDEFNSNLGVSTTGMIYILNCNCNFLYKMTIFVIYR
jgi:cob(I)alamin adenosyltransferase